MFELIVGMLIGFIVYPFVESYLTPLQKVRTWIANLFKSEE